MPPRKGCTNVAVATLSTSTDFRQGSMPEALQAAFTYAFTVLGIRLIHAECERENTASARVMQKYGMQYEGTMYDDDGLGNWAHRYRYVITAQTEKPL
jgi:RimJ/RimL family protein N-acetyltransferase